MGQRVDDVARADSRLAILAAARAMFGARGYAATSLVDVAKIANVTKGAVYHHFGSKQGLFRAVYDEVDAEMQRISPHQPDASVPPLELIQGFVAAFLDKILDPVVQRVMIVDGPAVLGLEPSGPLHTQPGFVRFRNVVSAAVASGDIKPVDPDAISRVIRGASLQAALYVAQTDDAAGARRSIGEALRALIGGLAV